MNSNEANRAIAKLGDIAKTMSNLERISAKFNENFVAYTNMVEKDIERHTFTPIDPKALTPRFYVGCEVVVYDETHLRDGWRGIIRKLRENSADVELEDEHTVSLSGSQMIPLRERAIASKETVTDANDLPIPALVDDAKIGPNQFIPDAQGRLYPGEWRNNLGMDKIVLTHYDHLHENQLMTEEAFRIYNAGLSESGLDKTVQVEAADESWKGDF